MATLQIMVQILCSWRPTLVAILPIWNLIPLETSHFFFPEGFTCTPLLGKKEVSFLHAQVHFPRLERQYVLSAVSHVTKPCSWICHLRRVSWSSSTWLDVELYENRTLSTAALRWILALALDIPTMSNGCNTGVILSVMHLPEIIAC